MNRAYADPNGPGDAPLNPLVSLDLVWQELASIIDVVHDLLFELSNLFTQQTRGGGQFSVLCLKRLNFVLEPRYSLQLALSAFGRGYSVAKLFPLRLDALLRVHVDWRQRRAVAEALHVGDRLRLVLQGVQALLRAQGMRGGRREGDRVRRVVHRGPQGAVTVAVQVGVHGQVRVHGDGGRARAEVQTAGRRARAAVQLVLLVQVLERLHKALRELLLVAHRLWEQELRGRRRSDHAIRLNDQSLQFRRGQFQESKVRRVQDPLGVSETRPQIP
ncbi:hypothetical protein ANANG_G00131600, partial [Anguilla anguilla]